MKMPKMPLGGNMMKQLQDAMERAQNLEKELAAERFEVTSGGGMVTVTFNGVGEPMGIKISKEVVDPDDVEMLEDMVLGAVREGFEKAVKIREEKTAEIQAAMPKIPGMNIPGF